MNTAIWIAILTVLALIGCGWLLIVAREIRYQLQPTEEDQ